MGLPMHGAARMSLHRHSQTPPKLCNHVKVTAGYTVKISKKTTKLVTSPKTQSFRTTSMHLVIRRFADCVKIMSLENMETRVKRTLCSKTREKHNSVSSFLSVS